MIAVAAVASVHARTQDSRDERNDRRWDEGTGRLDRTVHTESGDAIEMPVNAIDKLHQEHANMRRILLERQDTPDLVLLAKTLYYVREFSSTAHPSTEDIIFGKLLTTSALVNKRWTGCVGN